MLHSSSKKGLKKKQSRPNSMIGRCSTLEHARDALGGQWEGLLQDDAQERAEIPVATWLLHRAGNAGK
jgi:hypothetical protein